MNVIFISIDSLSRDFLKVYGQPIEIEVQTPNLDRFAQKACVFDRHYAGSLPCMPARREFLAGVQEFLWRPWGPMEPFDTPLARAARQVGAVTQLVTDHYHYFQHGSHGYYEDYHGYDFVRGHEYDTWRTAPRDPAPGFLKQIGAAQEYGLGYIDRAAYARNVAGFETEEDFFPAKVFSRAAEWLQRNQDHPRRLLVVDSFDVHEPFHCPEPYASMYTDEDPESPEMIVWPVYGRIDEGPSRLTERQLAFVRAQFAGKVTMVDHWLGEVFDQLDELSLWDDTMVIVTTDHGHYLGEHGWMGKPNAPLYDVLAATPLLIWHPEARREGARIPALTSAVDLHATMLEALGAPVSGQPHSRSLLPLIRGERDTHRDWALYGYWGSTVNVTDGRYTYLHPCRRDVPAYLYSTMMMNPWEWFRPPETQKGAEAGRFLPYTDSPVWRYPAASQSRHDEPLLFDVREDPGQTRNLAGQGAAEEGRLHELLLEALRRLRAPAEQYERLGLAGT